ncbi:MAG: hypothetical protein ACT6Q5_06545 [Sphingopyxis solisilvae]|uniref:hypothetical protein n=1 Tax=Sphingopyxis solisilvae TaxID=1886788 RepID=UPI004036C92C
MKKLLVAASVLAAMASTPAWADGDNTGLDTETFTLNANNPPKCNLEASTYTLTLANNVLSNDDGFARNDVSNSVASALNTAGVHAWCTGARNTLQMYRTPFAFTAADEIFDPFSGAVIYDISLNIADAVRTDGFAPTEGTSDGKGNGPGIGVGSGLRVGRFGPTGLGTPVVFASEAPSAATSVTFGDGPRSDFTPSDGRLVAGAYASSVTIELTPGN